VVAACASGIYFNAESGAWARYRGALHGLGYRLRIVLALMLALLGPVVLAAPGSASVVDPHLLTVSVTSAEIAVGESTTLSWNADARVPYLELTYERSDSETQTIQWYPAGDGTSDSTPRYAYPSDAGMTYRLTSVNISGATYHRDGSITYTGDHTGPSQHSVDFTAADYHVAATAPGAPASVSAAAGNGAATLQWTAAAPHGPSVTGYTITPQTNGVPAAPATTVAGNLTSTTITGLSNGTSYSFSITATNAIGDSPATLSNPLTPAFAPAAPASVTAHAQVNSATVNWQAPNTDGGAPVTGYTVTSSPGGKTCGSNGSGRSCQVAGLTNGISYTFAVTATNLGGTSPAAISNVVTPRPDTAPPVVTAASVTPSRVSSLGGNVTVEVHITDDVSGTLSNQTIVLTRVGGGQTFGFGSISRVSGDPWDGMYRATVAVPSGTLGNYNLLVYPTSDVAGNSGSFTTYPGIQVGAAGPPTEVSANAAPNRDVTVSWTAPVDDGGNAITGYRVTSTPDGPTFNTSGTTLTTSAFNDWPAAQPVTFHVAALNGGGSSDVVDSAPLTVPATPPDAPGSPTASGGDRAAHVSWTAPAVHGSPITGYTITSSLGAITTTVPPDATSATVTGLTNGTA
jgi:hypothetical protein